MSTYFSIVTLQGQARIASAIAGNGGIAIATLAVGDGNGQFVTPVVTATTLAREIWRGAVQSVSRDPNQPTQVIVRATVPSTIGPATVREMAIYDVDGNCLALANYPATDIAAAGQGAVTDIDVMFVFRVDTSAPVTIVVNHQDKIPLSQLLRAPFIAVDDIRVTPPANPQPGALVLINWLDAEGAFIGLGGYLAQWNGQVWLSCDVPAYTIVGNIGDGMYYRRNNDRSWQVWNASHDGRGIVRLATGEESNDGVNNDAAVTPAGLRNALTNWHLPVPRLLRAPFIGVDAIASHPPAPPYQTGATYLVAWDAATDAWIGLPGYLVQWTGSAWLEFDAPIGTIVANAYDGFYYRRTAGRTWTQWAADDHNPGLTVLATIAECLAGLDAVKTVTPAGLRAVLTRYRLPLTADVTLWVRTDGDDAHDGSANDAAHAFATLAGAWAYAKRSFDLAGWRLRLRLGVAGRYAGVVFDSSGISGAISVEGDVMHESDYVVAVFDRSAQGLASYCIASQIGTVQVTGVTLDMTLAANAPVNAVWANGNGASIRVGPHTTILTTLSNTHALAMACDSNAMMSVSGSITISGGGAGRSIYALIGSWIGARWVGATPDAPAIITLAHLFDFSAASSAGLVVYDGTLALLSTTFAGTGGGAKYNVGAGGNLMTGGAVLLGSSPGVVATGGYVS